MSAHHKADMVAVLGKTGCGKSTTVKRRLKAERGRVLVWDFKREYAGQGFTATDSLGEFVRLVRGKGKRLAFCPSLDDKPREKQFALWCDIVYQLGNVLAVVEELAFVTSPSRAPPRWRLMTLTGRHEGLRVIATSQRPASIDKDFLGNCTVVRSFALRYPRDARAVADALTLDDSRQLLTLQPGEFFEYRDGQGVKKGKLQLR